MVDISEQSRVKGARIFEVGCKNPDMQKFDISFATDSGTTYNSYLLLGSSNILIDGVRADFVDEYLRNIGQIISLSSIDYLLVHHTEPDHSGSLAAFLKIVPQVKVISSRCASIFLKEIMHMPFQWEEAKDGYILDLGWDRLRIIKAPFLHWPDTILSYLEKSQILFSCDAFGAHYCPENLLGVDFLKIKSYYEYYIDSIIRPFRSKVNAAMSKISDIPIKTIAPSHGPIHIQTKDILRLYKEWSRPFPERDKPRILMIYCSVYGSTEKILNVLHEELTKLGTEVVVKEILDEHIENIRNELEMCQGLLIGTPTIAGDAPEPAWKATSLIHGVEKEIKAAGTFGSFGWSGEACELINQRLIGLKIPVHSPLKIQFLPETKTENKIKEFAQSFFDFLLKKSKWKNKPSTKHNLETPKNQPKENIKRP